MSRRMYERTNPWLVLARRMIGIATALVLTAVSVGSSPIWAQSDVADLHVRLQFARPGGLYDPGRFTFASDWFVYPSIFNWLVRWAPGTGGERIEPDLAERWTVSADGLVYTFALRRGVQFHKSFGEMTAADVVASYQRQMTDERMAFNFAMRQIARIEAPDRYTVRIQLKEPNASFLPAVVAYAPGVVLPRAALDQYRDEFAKTPVGTGPFVFDRIAAGRDVIVSANDQYFRGRPPIRRITFTHIADEVVAATALMKGEMHIIWTRGNPEAARLLSAAPGIKTQRVVVYNSLRQMTISPHFKPTQDVRVRRALSYAINRQQIAAAFPGLELPTDVIRSNKVFGGSLTVPRYPYSPDRARQLLAEAGYQAGFRVRIMYQTRQPEDILANIVQSSWRTVGIDAVLEPVDPLLAFERRDRLEFDVTVNSEGRPDPDLFYTDIFSSTAKPPGGHNYFGYAGADDLIVAARREQSPAKRQAIYEQLHRRLMTDLPVIPLSNQIFVAAWRDPVEGLIHGINNNFLSETIKLKR